MEKRGYQHGATIVICLMLLLSVVWTNCWAQAHDVLYTDLMSPMYPDDNTHSLMLPPQQSVQVLILRTFYVGCNRYVAFLVKFATQTIKILPDDMTGNNHVAYNWQ